MKKQPLIRPRPKRTPAAEEPLSAPIQIRASRELLEELDALRAALVAAGHPLVEGRSARGITRSDLVRLATARGIRSLREELARMGVRP
jgi:hypothetical protein